MSVFLNAHQATERFETYAEEFRDVFRRHSVSFGRPSDFPQLAPKLMRRDSFRADFSTLLQWIQKREEGRLTVEQMLKIIGSAVAGPRGGDVRASNLSPLMVFLSGLGGWNEKSAAPKGSNGGTNGGRTPDSFHAASEATRARVNAAPVSPVRVNAAPVSPAPVSPAPVSPASVGPASVREVRVAEEKKPVNAEARDVPRIPETPGYARVSATPGSSERVEEKTVQRERDIVIRERPATDQERVQRIRQQLEELNTGAKASEPRPLRYREITPVESPASEPWQPNFAKPEKTAAESQSDIFRAFRTDVAVPQRPLGLRSVAMAAIAKLTGIARPDERMVRALVGAFGFLVLLPPFVVCVLLYRDSLTMASRSSPEPFVTRVQGNELRVIDANAKRGGKGRAKAGQGDLPLIVRGPGKIHVAGSDEVPLIAEGKPGLVGMPDSKGGAENWMSILGHMDEIDVSPRVIQLDSTSPKIRTAKLEKPPIGDARATMPGRMPKAVVQLGYPVVFTKADAADKNALTAGAGRGKGSVVSDGTSSTKLLDLVNPSVDVSGGLLSGNIVKFEMPSYPKAARKQGLEGDVLVHVLISDKGKIDRAVAVNGPPTLRGTVEKAVRRWRYKPYLQDGRPVQVQTWVTFHFAMNEG